MKNDIRTAILKAADHIEANPGSFDYSSLKVPDCGTPGCALGWIAVFRGHSARTHTGLRACFALEGDPAGVKSRVFYQRMDRLSDRFKSKWREDAAICAHALRAYADKYHPAPAQQPPDWQQMAADLSRADRIPEDA